MRNCQSIVRHVLLAIAVATIAVSGCARTQRVAVAQPEPYADSHLHIANYAMQGIPLKEFIDRYMGEKIACSAVFGLPFQQKWDAFEHFAEDRMPPNYYLGPKAGVYYYSLIDAMIAMEYRKLSAVDKARIDPMIVGFNPMDQYGTQHIKRILLMYPGVFAGIGEFSVHKELIGDKISDDTVKPLSPGAPIPPDVTDKSRNTLYNPSLKTILDFAAEAGLVVNLHSDVYRAEVTYDGKVVRMTPQAPHTAGMKQLCTQSPNTTVYWGPYRARSFREARAQSPRRSLGDTGCLPELVRRALLGPRPGLHRDPRAWHAVTCRMGAFRDEVSGTSPLGV
jgi:hypothetical protein